jgi:type VI secretion system protein ImpJ
MINGIVMRFLSKVVWSEGMYLGPHHFQAQNRYFEDSIRLAVSSFWFQPYGLLGCSMNEDALRNGTLSLIHARGIFEDGMLFLMPECDALPTARAIADLFPPTRDRITIMLGIPKRKPGGLNCSLSTYADGVRYTAEDWNFRDETTGGDERPVQIARKNIRFFLDTESIEGLVTLPVARVTRDGAGHLVLDPSFIPPTLQISASERIMSILLRLIEILEEKSGHLQRSSPGAQGAGEFAPRDIANYWLLHAVNTALSPLRHLCLSKCGHPEELFVELSRLAGALCTFGLESHPRTLPAYDHERLGECFDALDRHIRTHLELVIPTNCVAIPLEKIKDNFYEGDVVDTRCLGRARWILGIRSGLGEAELITKVPQLVKICSAKFVSDLVRKAMSGLPLIHVPVPPPAIRTKLEAKYFGITRSGPFWEHIVQTKRVGVYIPSEISNPEVELLVVLES